MSDMVPRPGAKIRLRDEVTLVGKITSVTEREGGVKYIDARIDLVHPQAKGGALLSIDFTRISSADLDVLFEVLR